MTEQKKTTKMSICHGGHGKYSFSAKIQNGRLSSVFFKNARNCATKGSFTIIDIYESVHSVR